jgi:hypothetical protein
MPLWIWLAGAAVGAYLLLGSSSNSYPANTSQGSVSSRTPQDWQALWTWAQTLGTTPQILGLTLFEESGMDPGASNAYGCVGLNQFCSGPNGTAGTYEAYVNIPKSQYLQLSMAQQLQYIGPFWQSKPASAMQSARGLFWVNFLPATYVANASPDTVVNDPNVLGASYAALVAQQNSSISQGKSTITAGDLDNYLQSYAESPGWQLALQQIAANAPGSDTGGSPYGNDDGTDDDA